MTHPSPAPGNQIDVVLRRSGVLGGVAPLRRFTVAILDGAIRASGWQDASVSVLYCDRREIRRLNAEFRGFDEETDVLSFPAVDDPEELVGVPEPHLGDLAICLPYTAHGAEEAGRDLDEEVALLLVHGFLHLLGHDHDTAPKKKKMWRRTDEILKALAAIPRPRLELKKGL